MQDIDQFNAALDRAANRGPVEVDNVISQADFERERVDALRAMTPNDVAEDLEECPSFEYAERTGDANLIGAMWLKAKEMRASRLAWRFLEHDDMVRQCDTEKELAKIAAQWALERQGRVS